MLDTHCPFCQNTLSKVSGKLYGAEYKYVCENCLTIRGNYKFHYHTVNDKVICYQSYIKYKDKECLLYSARGAAVREHAPPAPCTLLWRMDKTILKLNQFIPAPESISIYDHCQNLTSKLHKLIVFS